MKKRRFRNLFVSAVIIFFIFVFILCGFLLCIRMAQKEAVRVANEEMVFRIGYVCERVGIYFESVEDESLFFARASRKEKNVLDAGSSKLRYTDIQKFLDICERNSSSIYSVTIVLNKPSLQVSGDIYGHRSIGVARRLDGGSCIRFCDRQEYEEEWYSEAIRKGAPCWSGVLYDSSQNRHYLNFSIPFYDDSLEECVLVMAFSVDLCRLNDQCKALLPFDDAELYGSDKDGYYFCFPYSEWLGVKANVEEILAFGHGDAYYDGNGYAVFRILWNDGKKYMMGYTTFGKDGYIIAISMSEDILFRDVKSLTVKLLVVFILCLVILLFSSFPAIRGIASAVKERINIEDELKIASDIQMGMLPDPLPVSRREYGISGFLSPAKQVGGDLYDYFESDGKLMFLVGDVSDKGVPAALFMAGIMTLLRSISVRNSDPASVVSILNSSLSKGKHGDMFCTLLFCVLDIGSGRLVLCNAGHDKPVILHTDEIGEARAEFVEVKPNIPVGIFEDFKFENETIILGKGDKLFLYTDGVTEARNRSGKFWGDEALLSALGDCSGKSAEATVGAVRTAMRAFVDGAEQSDDITMLAVDYKGQ